jgi:membrane-associated protein
MDTVLALWHRLSDVEGLIRWGGTFVLFAIIFAECGLLLGFFLPGDSLLVSSGLLASQGLLNVWWLGALLTVAAITGQQLGYSVGRKAGQLLFTREDSRFFKRSYLLRAHAFYEEHGAKAVVLARFMPIFRTFVPVVAGAALMDFRKYTIYNLVGGTLWIWSMLMIGYLLGLRVPGISAHIDLVIIVVIILSLMPGAIAWLRRRRPASPSTPSEV